jgi:hypothetical protein
MLQPLTVDDKVVDCTRLLVRLLLLSKIILGLVIIYQQNPKTSLEYVGRHTEIAEGKANQLTFTGDRELQ